jgi:hypothetical protein
LSFIRVELAESLSLGAGLSGTLSFLRVDLTGTGAGLAATLSFIRVEPAEGLSIAGAGLAGVFCFLRVGLAESLSTAGAGLAGTLFFLRFGLAGPTSDTLCFVGDGLAGTSSSLIGAGLSGAFRGVGSEEGGCAPLDRDVLAGVLTFQ